jgi:hypothetical protein
MWFSSVLGRLTSGRSPAPVGPRGHAVPWPPHPSLPLQALSGKIASGDPVLDNIEIIPSGKWCMLRRSANRGKPRARADFSCCRVHFPVGNRIPS